MNISIIDRLNGAGRLDRIFIEGEWVLLLSGFLSVVFGILVAFWPGAGLVAVTWIIGAYAIAFGIHAGVVTGHRRVVDDHGVIRKPTDGQP